MSGVAAGFLATGIALVVFLVWTWRELRRIDEIAGPPPGDGER